MEPDTSTSYVPPWWERRQLCRSDMTPAGCSVGSFVKLECTTEPNEYGVPTKRCIRLHKRLLHCPGRPAQTTDEKQEILTLAGEEAQLPLPDPSSLGSSSRGAADGSVAALAGADPLRAESAGPDLEELLRLADELHDKFLPGTMQLDPEPAPEPRAYTGQGRGEGGLFSYLGSLWRVRRQPKQDQKSARLWEEYSKEFQEV